MAHTVESFVDKLRTDGVEAGRQAAEEIRREAQQQADETIRRAEAEAKRIVEQAEQQREQTVERTRTDLELAARDVVAKLRETLSQTIARVLEQAAASKLEDDKFLGELIRDVICQYAEADALGKEAITINVAKPMRQKLADWAIKTFHKPCEHVSVDLHGSLSTAGFEYRVAGGTVEVTTESVVKTLAEIVTPELQAVINSATKDQASEGQSQS